MLCCNIFDNKFLDLKRKECLGGGIFIQFFSLLGYDELKCRSFMAFGLKTAAFWTLTDHGIQTFLKADAGL